MSVYVPTLTRSLYLTDPKTVIAYTLRKYMRTPKNAIPFVDDVIISLPQRVAAYGREPEVLVRNMENDLQEVFNRIFQGERDIKVLVNYTSDNDVDYNVSIQVTYQTYPDEVDQIGTAFPIKDGRITIPQDNLTDFLKIT